MAFSHFPIIELDSIDSTNNYAMQLIDANKAQQGLTIVAQSQSAGKGQRGKLWIYAPGESLLMSVIVLPESEISGQFVFNASVVVAITAIVRNYCPDCDIRIKWPNDIIINAKKAGGILIENVLRGSRWTHAVIGLGLNIKQHSFPENLPFATSLKRATGNDIDITKLRDDIIENVMSSIIAPRPEERIMAQYNEHLYKRGQKQAFSDGSSKWEATILNAHKDGTLEVQLSDGSIMFYQHGQVLWDWE